MPNTPVLDKSVQWRIRSGTLDFQEQTYRSTAQAILSTGLATEVVRLISAGKEADVYLATYQGAPLAVKSYRLYRTVHRGGRAVKVDNLSWRAAREFELLRKAWKGGAPVPTPARRVENMFSMRYLGGDAPAPRLHDVRLEDPEAALAAILAGVESMALAGVVHGDLSAFNVLVHDARPWLIDLSGGIRVDRTGAVPWVRLTRAADALRNGLAALQVYFRRYGLGIDAEPFVAATIDRLDRFGVLR